ncbi:MAG: FtsX-like permease family protein [Lachnospiraceae bacterium]|nr:FtsX-like permease family protein [Lachnospiraceae bacterium]
MNKTFYLKLATDNIKKNMQTYLPYCITCIFTLAIYYIMASLSYNKGLEKLIGADTITAMMNMGCIIIAVFSFIFLIYTNSFLMKRRKKEFGLFNILGMERRHLVKLIGIESLLISVCNLVLGLLLGMLFDKFLKVMIIKNVMRLCRKWD